MNHVVVVYDKVIKDNVERSSATFDNKKEAEDWIRLIKFVDSGKLIKIVEIKDAR